MSECFGWINLFVFKYKYFNTKLPVHKTEHVQKLILTLYITLKMQELQGGFALSGPQTPIFKGPLF